jgi:hypothetical protein
MTHQANIYIDTGHQIVLGLLRPLLLHGQHHHNISLVRLRRDRLKVAKSFYQDPKKEGKGPCAFIHTRHGLTLCPFQHACVTAHNITPPLWHRLNRFQQYLWYVDQVEQIWQQILSDFGANVRTLEIDIDDGVVAFDALSAFIGIPYRHEAASIKLNPRATTPHSSNDDLLLYAKWDDEYHRILGNVVDENVK